MSRHLVHSWFCCRWWKKCWYHKGLVADNLERSGCLAGYGKFSPLLMEETHPQHVHHEIHIWTGLQHPNIASFYGIMREDNGSISWISPYFKDCNIVEYIKSIDKSQACLENMWSMDEWSGLDWESLIWALLDERYISQHELSPWGAHHTQQY